MAKKKAAAKPAAKTKPAAKSKAPAKAKPAPTKAPAPAKAAKAAPKAAPAKAAPAKAAKPEAKPVPAAKAESKPAGGLKAIPEGYHTLTPYLIVRGTAHAIEFYKRAFGAIEIGRMPGPDGFSIMHAEIKIGDSHVMLTDENPQWNVKSPPAFGGTSVSLHMYVEDADKAYQQAIDAGATAKMPPADMFWGDRFGKLIDPFGHEWSIATHKEDVPPAEMAQRAQAFFGTKFNEPQA